MDSPIFLIAVGAFVLLMLVVVATLNTRRRATLPYQLRDTLLSAAELSFYGVLQQAAPGYDIFAKVRLIDLVLVPAAARDRHAHINRVLSKHVDFVLCDPATSAPLLAIELDDSSHQNRLERDAFVNQVFELAGLPLLRVPARRGYNAKELAEFIQSRARSGADGENNRSTGMRN